MPRAGQVDGELQVVDLNFAVLLDRPLVPLV